MAVTRALTDTAVSVANAATYNFAGTTLDATADHSVVQVCAPGNGSGVTTSVTVDGQAASLVTDGSTSARATGPNDLTVDLWIAAASGNSSGTVSVSLNQTQNRLGIAVWGMTGADGSQATDVATDNSISSNALSASLTIPANGVGIGAVHWKGNGADRTTTWNNLTEDHDTSVGEGDNTFSGASSTSGGGGAAARTATASGSLLDYGLVVAAWESSGTEFNQSVTANVDASVDVSVNVGKAVSPNIDLAVAFGAFAISKLVSPAIDLSVSITKAIAKTLTASGIDLSAVVSAPKNILQSITASLTASVTVLKNAGKIISPAIDFSVSITRSIGKIVQATVSLLALIFTPRNPESILSSFLGGKATDTITSGKGTASAKAGSGTRSISAGRGSSSISSGKGNKTIRRF